MANIGIEYNVMKDCVDATREVLGADNPSPITPRQLPEAIRSIPYGWYGVKRSTTSLNTVFERTGSQILHRSLPVQTGMRRCLVRDDGSVNYYLHPSDSRYKANGEPAVLDGTDGQIEVEIIPHYHKFEYDTEGNVIEAKFSMYNLPGFEYFPLSYMSMGEASLDRTSLKLSSVVNKTTRYRGGNNATSWDNTYRSLLGMPATNLTLTQFRTYAHNRGANWHPNVYDIYQELVWLYWCEYANTNCQLPFNATLTQDGYRQGGLGDGVTTWTSSAWNSFNGYNPVVPVGTTLSLGNRTGVVPYSVKNSAGNTVITFQVPSWRGIENLFGHVWAHTDGILENVQSNAAGGKNLVYVCHDPAHFADTINEHYELQGEQARTEGYTKNIIFPCIVASSVGADSSTGYADYNYTTIPSSGSEVRCVLLGGHAHRGAHAGLAYALSRYAPSYAYASVGSRLCFTPSNT